MTVGAGVPSMDFRLQNLEVGNPSSSEALPGHQAEFNLGLIQPTAVFRRVVHLQAAPKVAALSGSEVVSEGLAARNVEMVHHQMDVASEGIGRDQILDHQGKLRGRAIGAGASEVPSGFRLDDGEDISGAVALVFVIALGYVTGLQGWQGRTSACKETGFSSKHRTGSVLRYGFSYRARTSSIGAM